VRSVASNGVRASQAIVPALVQAAGLMGVPVGIRRGGGRPVFGIELDTDLLSERVVAQLSRLSSAIVLAGMGLVAGLTVLAFYLRPATELAGIDLLALLVPATAIVTMIVALRSWQARVAGG
jgi:hypothetical protein